MSRSIKRNNAKAINEIMQQISSDPSVIESLIMMLGDKSTARFGAAKKLQLVSRVNPSLLYPHFEVFAKLLDNTSIVLLWNGIIILSYLVSVDSERRFDSVFDSFYKHLWDGKLVTAANILGNSGLIARCRPDLASRITTELLKVDDIPLPTAECREVARGHVLASFAQYIDMLKAYQPVYDFLIRCTTSHRLSVKKQANELINIIS